MAEASKFVPVPSPETLSFWEGLREGELRLQRCDRAECASVIFPPRPFCPRCGAREVSTFRATGRGALYSYVINHRPAPGFEREVPYTIAVVALDEGPRLMTNLVGVEHTPEALPLDMPLELAPEPVNADITLPKFRPVRSAS